MSALLVCYVPQKGVLFWKLAFLVSFPKYFVEFLLVQAIWFRIICNCFWQNVLLKFFFSFDFNHSLSYFVASGAKLSFVSVQRSFYFNTVLITSSNKTGNRLPLTVLTASSCIGTVHSTSSIYEITWNNSNFHSLNSLLEKSLNFRHLSWSKNQLA